jgi:hypothetical protein
LLQLEQFIHCRNCPVLAEAARTFFDRAAPAGYLDAWQDILQQPVLLAEEHWASEFSGAIEQLMRRRERQRFTRLVSQQTRKPDLEGE